MMKKDSIAIGLSDRRLRALEVTHTSRGVRATRVLRDVVPDTIEVEDADAVGAWIGTRLRDEGFSRDGVTFAIPREHASLKRLTLPTTDRFELPDMVRLSMARELPFDPEEAVIDFIPVGRGDQETTVVVTAMQQQRVERARRIARAARLRIDRIALRCMGVVHLLNTQSDMTDEQQAVLGVDVTGDGVEIAVLTGGHLRFSRAAKIPHSDDAESFADDVSTETRRSWMSYRIVEDAPDISRAYVFGDPVIVKHVAKSIEDFMKVKAECVSRHPQVDVDRCDLSSTWPLAGLLLERAHDAETIDFSRPREAPDRHARRRQLALAGAGVLVMLLAGAFMFGFKDLRALQAQADDLGEQVKDQVGAHYQYERDLRRLQHIERWMESRVDWMGHVAFLAEQLPGTDALLLDQLNGSLRFGGVDYDSRDREWIVARDIVFTLDGEATTQSVIDQLRGAFAEDDLYEITSGGADASGGKRYGFPFKFTLRTGAPAPPHSTGNAQSRADARARRVAGTGGGS